MHNAREHPRNLAPGPRDDAFAERIAAALRSTETPDPMLTARVLSAIRSTGEAPAPAAVALVADRVASAVPPPVDDARRSAMPGSWRWRGTVAVGVMPLASLLVAACLAVVVLVRGPLTDHRTAVAVERLAATEPPARVDTVHLVRFVFVAPEAKSVALVGNFNSWDRSAVQLTRSEAGGAWTATVPLPSGRHEYAFLVDGDRWAADPNARATVEDEFGVASSVVTVAPARPAPTGRT